MSPRELYAYIKRLLQLLTKLFQVPFLRSSDANDIHGALLSLSEIASAYRDQMEPLENERLEVLACTYLSQ